jgi:hypothetical protein
MTAELPGLRPFRWEANDGPITPRRPDDNVEIRTVICSTNAIKSVNARIRKAVPARSHFPNEQAALKCVYMALVSLGPTGAGHRRWTMRWKAPLNAFQTPAHPGRPLINLNNQVQPSIWQTRSA